MANGDNDVKERKENHEPQILSVTLCIRLLVCVHLAEDLLSPVLAGQLGSYQAPALL